jgi:hypothetical protein
VPQAPKSIQSRRGALQQGRSERARRSDVRHPRLLTSSVAPEGTSAGRFAPRVPAGRRPR